MREDLGLKAMGARLLAPALEGGGVFVVEPEAEIATLDPLKVGVEFLAETLPEFDGLDGERDEMRVADLLMHPAPIAGGLFVTDRALVDEDDVDTALGEVVGGGAAHDAAADDHDVCFPRK